MNLNALLEAACEVQRVLEREGATFCFIGGLAIQRWGEPRFTNDVDLSLITRFVEDDPKFLLPPRPGRLSCLPQRWP